MTIILFGGQGSCGAGDRLQWLARREADPFGIAYLYSPNGECLSQRHWSMVLKPPEMRSQMKHNLFVIIVSVFVIILGTTGPSIEVATASELFESNVQTSRDPATRQARRIVRELRNELAPVEDQIRNVPFLTALEAGEVSIGQLQAFACEEFNIVSSDIRSNALLVSRLGPSPGGTFFNRILDGEFMALQFIIDFGAALGLRESNLSQCEPRAGGQAFPAYVSSLAAFSNQADVAAAFLLNFPIFGENTGRMADALQVSPYNFSADDVAFFTFFATPVPGFEEQAIAVIAEGLRSGAKPRLIKRSARLLQAYELLFWLTVGVEAQEFPFSILESTGVEAQESLFSTLESTGVEAQESPSSTPESTSIFSFLALGSLGAISALKRKEK